MFWGTIFSSRYLRDISDWSVGIRVWSCCSHFGGGCPERGLLEKDLSRLLLRVTSLICIVDLFLGQWFIILVFAGDAEFAPTVSVRDGALTGVETDGQPRVHHAVVTRSLVSLAAGFSLTSLKLSTVGVKVGS